MNEFESDGSSENEWDDRGDLAWNEFDWERYLREQDETIHRYLGFYEAFKNSPDRIDQVAEKMGWDQPDTAGESGAAADTLESSSTETPQESRKLRERLARCSRSLILAGATPRGTSEGKALWLNCSARMYAATAQRSSGCSSAA